MPAFIPDKIAHFWSRVEKTPGGCWLWTGAKFKQGYGCAWDGKRRLKAHRFSYQCSVGDIPPGLLVLHKCDVRLCVNPDHLFVGDHKDNYDDMVAKGRGVILCGETHGGSKLTAKAVRYIRRVWNPRTPGLNQRLMKKFGLTSDATIPNVINGRTWKSVS